MPTMNLKGYQFPKDIILETLRYYLAALFNFLWAIKSGIIRAQPIL